MPVTGEKRPKNWTDEIKKMKIKAFLKKKKNIVKATKYLQSTLRVSILISVTVNCITNKWTFCRRYLTVKDVSWVFP